MTCIVEQRRRHQALAEHLTADPRVAAVDIIPADLDPSNMFTTEVILERDIGTVPPAVLNTIADAGMGIATVTPRARFDHLLVTIR